MKCIAKVANMTNLGERTKRQGAEIMHNIAKKETLPEKILMGLATSILYLSSIKTGEIITQSDFVRAA